MSQLALSLARWSTYLLALLLPLSIFWPAGPPAATGVLPLYVSRGVYLSDLPLALLLAASLAGGLYHRLPSWPLSVPLLGLGVLGGVTAVFAILPPFALYTAVRWLIAALLALWLAQGVVDRRTLVLVFLAGLAGQTLIGLGQVLAQRPLGLPGELALHPAVSGAAIVELASGRWLRAYGLTFHPNVLGGFLAAGLALALPLLDRRWAWPLWWLLWLGLFLSFSRAAWIAAGLVVPLAGGWLALGRGRAAVPRAALSWAAAGALLVLLLAGIVWREPLAVRLGPLLPAPLRPGLAVGPSTTGEEPTGTGVVAATEAYSLEERASLLVVARALIAERPFTGVGAGSFPLAIAQRGDPVRPQFVHNVTLMLAAEVGLAGGALWLLLGLGAVVMLLRRRRVVDAWTVAAVGGWLAIFSLSLFDSYPWGLNAGRLLTAVVLGLAMGGLDGRPSAG